jgi:amino acid transporter
MTAPRKEELPPIWAKWKLIVIALFSVAGYLVSTVAAPLPQEDAVYTADIAKLFVVFVTGITVAIILHRHHKGGDKQWNDDRWLRVTLKVMVCSFALYAVYTFVARPLLTSACGTRAPLNKQEMFIGFTPTTLGQVAWDAAQKANPLAKPTWPQVIEGAYSYRENLWPQWQKRVAIIVLHTLYIAVSVSFAVTLVCLFVALSGRTALADMLPRRTRD